MMQSLEEGAIIQAWSPAILSQGPGCRGDMCLTCPVCIPRHGPYWVSLTQIVFFFLLYFNK